MRSWTFMLSGLIVWALHFAGLYLIASLEDFVGAWDGWRWIGAAFSALCLAAAAAIAWAASGALRRPSRQPRPFMAQIALLAAAMTCIAVIWQSLVLAMPPA